MKKAVLLIVMFIFVGSFAAVGYILDDKYQPNQNYEEILLEMRTCPSCGGDGLLEDNECPLCLGFGKVNYSNLPPVLSPYSVEFIEGYKNRDDRIPMLDCPYDNIDQLKGWELGWMVRNRELRIRIGGE